MIKFVASHLSGNGGTETVLVQVLNHIAKTQQVELVVFGSPSNSYWLSKLNKNITVKVVKYGNKYSKLFVFTREAWLTEKNDTVISLSPSFIKLLYYVRKAKHSNYQIISWIHFSLEDQDLFNPQDLIYADFHLAISNKIKNQLTRLGVSEKKIAVIFNPVKKAKAFQTLPHNKTNIAYIGRISFYGQKNLSELLSSLIGVNNIHLYIIGSGYPEEEQKCKKFISSNNLQKNITWAGWQKSPWEYLKDKNIDGTILTSNFEGLPMVFLESISRGIPVISSQFDGYDDVVKEDVNGLSYKLNDVHKLKSCILKIKNIKDKELIQDSISSYYSDNYFKFWDQYLQ